MSGFKKLSLVCVAFLFVLQSRGDDWPRWRGPNLNGISSESVATPGASSFKTLWKANVGVGFSSISVAQNRAYTMGNRGDRDTIYCFDAITGAQIWTHSYDEELDPKYYDGGTSCTPTVDGDAVYTLSRKGLFFCLDAAKGTVRWQKNIARDFKLEIPEWGFASSPLVEGNLLLVNAGSAGLALNKADGTVAWSSGKSGAGYSSGVPFDAQGKRLVAFFVGNAVIALDPTSGKVAWQYPWKTSYDVNAADPIVTGDKIFISSGYNRGCALLQFTSDKVTKVWETKNMRNQISPSVLHKGFIYGADGNSGEAELRCIDLKDGSVKWTHQNPKVSALIVANGKLLAQGERGELIVGDANSAAFKLDSQTQILGGKCWSTPTLANGRIYARNAKGDLVCVDAKSS